MEYSINYNLIFYFLLFSLSFSQENQIIIDGKFQDWEGVEFIEDNINDNGFAVDFTSLSITNDNRYLYIKFTTTEQIDLMDSGSNGESMYNTVIYIDTDNNNKTGYVPNYNSNIGSELGIFLNQRYVWYNTPNPNVQISLYDIGLFSAPTVTSNEFEIAIDLEAQYGGENLFPNQEIKIQLKDFISDDAIPNINSEIIYNINSNNLNYITLNTEKENEDLIRLSAYNVLYNGLDDNERLEQLKNIIKSVNADIYAFSECYETSSETVKNILDEILPISNNQGWYVIKKEDDDLITASKFPIIQDWPNESYGIKKMHPCLIDLPDSLFTKDLLVINAHMSCCDNDNDRQEQADDFVNFILDAKSTGGIIDLANETPFVLCGDLNLVGFSQQLQTLTSGEIIDTEAFGIGGGMNWSNNDLRDEICMHVETPFSYTWRDITPSPGSYSYGRLDYIIFSDDVMSSQKSFTIDTKFISQKKLNEMNLDVNDSFGSDHLLTTIDFDIPKSLSQKEDKKIIKKLLRKLNIVGQQKKKNKGLLINIYNDGSTEKKYKLQ
tara:strand:- start:322 stop:1974 length:1653 start_codon:yes stop_codon:yes gene_type:complete